MAAEDLRVTRPAGAAGSDGAESSAAERRKLRRVLGRLDTVFFLISAATLTGWGQLLGWPGYYIRCTLKVRDL